MRPAQMASRHSSPISDRSARDSFHSAQYAGAYVSQKGHRHTRCKVFFLSRREDKRQRVDNDSARSQKRDRDNQTTLFIAYRSYAVFVGFLLGSKKKLFVAVASAAALIYWDI